MMQSDLLAQVRALSKLSSAREIEKEYRRVGAMLMLHVIEVDGMPNAILEHLAECVEGDLGRNEQHGWRLGKLLSEDLSQYDASQKKRALEALRVQYDAASEPTALQVAIEAIVEHETLAATRWILDPARRTDVTHLALLLYGAGELLQRGVPQQERGQLRKFIESHLEFPDKVVATEAHLAKRYL